MMKKRRKATKTKRTTAAKKATRPKRNPEMRNISRVDQYKKNEHGWLVRVMRNGVNHQKFFYDSTYGGKSRSLIEAKLHRDELVRKYQLPPHGNNFNRITSRNTSGHPGISKSGSFRKGHYYEAWQASWVLPDGKRVARKFVFSPTGRTEMAAKRLAIKVRREAVAQIEAMVAKQKKRGASKATASRKGR